MSRKKLLIKLIDSSEKNEFDKIVKTYLKEVYGFERIVVTDGKDDLGIDIRVFDYGQSKIQYQLTIQKNNTSQDKNKLSTKLFEDVKKAKRNVEDYNYSNNLYFFYSHELTNKLKQDFQREALREYNINLDIIDATQIAEESESNLNLQGVIFSIGDFDMSETKESLYNKDNQNLIYDLVGFGKTSDIKLDIVESYILQCLFEKGSLSLKEIADLCTEKFCSKENQRFYDNLTNRLYNQDKKIEYSKETKKYSLTSKKREEVNNLIKQIRLDENYFTEQIKKILIEYKQEEFVDEYLKLLYELYVENFSKRIKLSLEIEDISLESLKFFVLKKLEKEQDSIQLLTKILQVCDDNKYLQRLCASTIFSQKVDIDNIRDKNNGKQIYIDTTIALNLLCYYYKTDIEYDNYYYKLSKSLYDYCKENEIQLIITNRYLWEVSSHIQEAFNLIPFTQISEFRNLGGSRNVFYNFYYLLNKEGFIKKSYIQFLDDFDFKESYTSKRINKILEKHLKELNIKIIDIEKTYNIDNTTKLIGNDLSIKFKYKTLFALNNDAIMLEYLGDSDIEVHNIKPIFITWDKTLFRILKDYFNENPNNQRWLQFTPNQFIDRYALLSFNINKETITKEMLAMLSGDIVQNTYSLLDTLSLILNPNDKIGLEYTKRFTKMKDEQIYIIEKTSDEKQESQEDSYLDRVVFNIVKYYREDKESYNDLKKLFTSEKHIEDVFSIIKNGIEYYKDKGQFDSNIINELNQQIKLMKKNNKDDV